VTGVSKLLRADCGVENHKVFARLQQAGWEYSIGAKMAKHVRALSSRSSTDQQTLKVTRLGATWSTSATLAQGTYTAQATQTDAAANVATSTTNAFTVDTTAPTLTALQMFRRQRRRRDRSGEGDIQRGARTLDRDRALDTDGNPEQCPPPLRVNLGGGRDARADSAPRRRRHRRRLLHGCARGQRQRHPPRGR
jgi:hypothetical protein